MIHTLLKTLKIYLIFFKCGLFAFGGGAAAAAWIEREIVNTLQWISPEEFSSAYAIGHTLPGPIASKLSALCGYKYGGSLGALMAVAGIVTPSAVAMIVFYKYINVENASGVVRAIKPIVVVLILNLLLKSIQASYSHPLVKADFMLQTFLIVLGAFLIIYLKLSPSIVIVGAIIFGALCL